MARSGVKLRLSGDAAADKLLSSNPFALLVGLVLDQQVPLEWAFHAPLLLQERLGGVLDAETVAATDTERLADLFRSRPALHRFPGSMAERVHGLGRLVNDEYGGDPRQIWEGVSSGDELLRRLEALPGFGKQKAKIFLAFLGKQLGVRPDGWREASAPFGAEGSRLSIADIDSAETLAVVRAHKREMKKAAAAKAPATRVAKKAASPR